MVPHKPIMINNVSLSFPDRDCFHHFTAEIRHGDRVAVIGRNGCGKSTLLKMLRGVFEPSDGRIWVPIDAVFGYVPQVIEEFDGLSGGERLNEALTRALVVSHDGDFLRKLHVTCLYKIRDGRLLPDSVGA